MVRKARVEFEGAVDHVLDRGNRRETIFGIDAVAGGCAQEDGRAQAGAASKDERDGNHPFLR